MSRVLRINEDFCKSCSLCIKYCPKGCLSFKENFNKKGYHPVKWNPQKCNFCGICYIVCPDNVIEIVENSK
ncbi:MAG: hypothetical protein DRI36_05300 [Caldiserica bacterium]|nr:MAG: hypothetical protein DRI36_05300 [Caldisericota bacterium]